MKEAILSTKLQRQEALIRLIKRLESRLGSLQKRSDQLVFWRFTIFISGAVLTLIALFSPSQLFFFGTLGLFSIIFTVVVFVHRRVNHTMLQYRIWLDLKQKHLARMRLDWDQLPARRLEKPSPIEIDLDFANLYRLLDTSTTRMGPVRLRDWLLTAHPSRDAINQRQSVIRELIRMPLFRDRLALNARVGAAGKRLRQDVSSIIAWLRNEPQQLPGIRGVLWILSGMALVTAVLFIVSSFIAMPPIWAVIWAIYILIYGTQWRRSSTLFEEAAALGDTLYQLNAVLGYIERYPYGRHQHVRDVCRSVVEGRPTTQLRHVTWTISAASLQRNFYLWFILNALMPWDLFFLYRLHRQKKMLAQYLPVWLDVWFELEAYCSLANFAYLHPEYCFPEVQSRYDDPVLSGTKIGHPLIVDSERVTNNFAFQSIGQVAIITGSNMAGKSSFLRTLGVNLALAYAGSVVAAESFSTTVFRLFTSIRVTDSLDDGISYFYAEVKRLKALLDSLQTDDLPLFFLIDEIFRGTNNRERLIGSRSYIRALQSGRGCGLIATHDLELTQLADESPHIVNYHFREEVTEGRMVFDYKLRHGPCPTTNALQIMALEGLPVEADL